MAALDKNTSSVSDEVRSARRRAYALRQIAWDATLNPRVAKCGRARVCACVEIVRAADGGCHYSGLERCGNIWCCPVCAGVVARRRAEELRSALRGHLLSGRFATFQTFTLPHSYGDTLEATRRVATEAFRAIHQGAAWLEDRATYGILAYVRALEVTHGPNGWHPHVHALFFHLAPLDADTFGAFARRNYDAWARTIQRHGLRTPLPQLCPAEVVTTGDVAAYTAKWGAAPELARWDTKRGRKGHRAPFGILADYGERRDPHDLELWREWERGMKGARQLTWSRGARRLLKATLVPDETIAAEEPRGEILLVLPGALWDAAARVPGLTLRVLEAAESAGSAAADALLAGELPEGLPCARLPFAWTAAPAAAAS